MLKRSPVRTSSIRVLLDAFEINQALRWLAFGILIGVLAEVSGASAVSGFVFSLASGFGSPMFLQVIAVSGLSLLGRVARGVGLLARGDFENFEGRVRAVTFRTAAALTGLALMGCSYTAITGSKAGVVLGAYAGWYSLCSLWCWGCLTVVAYRHHSKLSEPTRA